jgi:hypothetical protein
VDDHNCWWTRHRLTELTHDGTKLLAAGVPRRVVGQAPGGAVHGGAGLEAGPVQAVGFDRHAGDLEV